MDFHNLINVANQNVGSSGSEKYYKARFEPPKKESKEKKLSSNIKKFLQKREQEEREQRLKKDEEVRTLMAKRDTKQKNKINKMLKVIKSANKSVLADEKDACSNNAQNADADDDYGYVSQEASQFYAKLMQQYSNNPDTPAFDLNRNGKHFDKKSMQEKLERVKRGMDDRNIKEKEPKIRASKHPSSKESSKTVEPLVDVSKSSKPSEKPFKRPFRPAPSLSFNDILALAEKKQHEDIVIPTKSKQETGRLMTKKEREEEEQRLLVAKKKAERYKSPTEDKKNKPQKSEKTNSSKLYAALTVKQPSGSAVKTEKPIAKQLPAKMNGSKASALPQNISTNNSTKNGHAKDVGKRKQSAAELPIRKEPKMNPSSSKPVHVQESRNIKAVKRRIVDSDEESEYDSELDDFIDDGDEGAIDVSTQIRSIFGYDRRRYRDEDYDDREMESSFAQQMKEEQHSKKIGLMEDLEDMKQEELEKKRKAMLKKRKV